MGDDLVQRVYAHARGLGEALSSHAGAIDELLEVAQRDRDALVRSLELAEQEVGRTEEERSAAVGDEGPPVAPALLASRLLRDAIAELDSQNGEGWEG